LNIFIILTKSVHICQLFVLINKNTPVFTNQRLEPAKVYSIIGGYIVVSA